jgi:tetratricopeptide (TPR) repeat protein
MKGNSSNLVVNASDSVTLSGTAVVNLLNREMMKRIKRNWKKSIRFWMLMVMTALFCITSPSVAQIPSISSLIAQTQSAPSLEQQARSRYTAGQFTEAATLFQQAAQAYKATGDPIRQALSLSNLSLSYQQSGQWKEANQAIADSLALLQANDKTPERAIALAQALDIQGGLYLAQGKTEAALTSWERTTAIYTQQGKPTRSGTG